MPNIRLYQWTQDKLYLGEMKNWSQLKIQMYIQTSIDCEWVKFGHYIAFQCLKLHKELNSIVNNIVFILVIQNKISRFQ